MFKKKLLYKILAWIMRTFYTACPHCHKYFSGKHSHHKNVKHNGTHYRVICGKCYKDETP